MEQAWISTGEAVRILNIGICAETFRQKFKGCLPWKRTPGGQFRWLRQAVEDLAHRQATAS